VPSCAGDGEVGTNNRKMFQGKVKTEWLTKGALSPTARRGRVPYPVGTRHIAQQL
jgi:hypothetical protein